MIKRVVLDPGHGGTDPGASGITTREKDINLAVALKLHDILVDDGLEVLLTRDCDKYLSESARVKISNDWGADLFVAVHCNAYINRTANGIETWNAAQPDLAQQFQTALMSRFPDHIDRGVKKANFYVLKYTKCPAVLIEMEFITNPEQETFLKENVGNLADVIAGVIIDQCQL